MGGEKNRVAVAAIRECRDRASLDETLMLFKINNTQEAIDYLDICMYDPKKFYSARPTTVEEELEFTKQIFLTGTWRLNEYYERMSIPLNKAVQGNAGL